MVAVGIYRPGMAVSDGTIAVGLRLQRFWPELRRGRLAVRAARLGRVLRQQSTAKGTASIFSIETAPLIADSTAQPGYIRRYSRQHRA